jgi:hypothetical protein
MDGFGIDCRIVAIGYFGMRHFGRTSTGSSFEKETYNQSLLGNVDGFVSGLDLLSAPCKAQRANPSHRGEKAVPRLYCR